MDRDAPGPSAAITLLLHNWQDGDHAARHKPQSVNSLLPSVDAVW
jgi:hypothetical protein